MIILGVRTGGPDPVIRRIVPRQAQLENASFAVYNGATPWDFVNTWIMENLPQLRT